MERSKRIAIAYFEQYGFDVDDIPECDDPRADIRAFDSTRREYVTEVKDRIDDPETCLLYTSPSPRDQRGSRMPSSA